MNQRRIRQNRSRALLEDVHDASGADAHHVSKSRLSVRLLPYARFSAQLARDLGNLPGACVWRIADFPRISNSPHTGGAAPDLDSAGEGGFEDGSDINQLFLINADSQSLRPSTRTAPHSCLKYS